MNYSRYTTQKATSFDQCKIGVLFSHYKIINNQVAIFEVIKIDKNECYAKCINGVRKELPSDFPGWRTMECYWHDRNVYILIPIESSPQLKFNF